MLSFKINFIYFIISFCCFVLFYFLGNNLYLFLDEDELFQIYFGIKPQEWCSNNDLIGFKDLSLNNDGTGVLVGFRFCSTSFLDREVEKISKCQIAPIQNFSKFAKLKNYLFRETINLKNQEILLKKIPNNFDGIEFGNLFFSFPNLDYNSAKYCIFKDNLGCGNSKIKTLVCAFNKEKNVFLVYIWDFDIENLNNSTNI